MSFHYLSRALDAKMQEDRRYNIDERCGYFGAIYTEIEGAVSGWHWNLVNLLDIRNWRLDKLIDSDGNIRKPKIYLYTEMTTKGNLSLEWQPARQMSIDYHSGLPTNLSGTDFYHWSNAWPAGSQTLPFNRLLMIRDFNYLMYNRVHSRADLYLLKAYRALLEDILMFLKRLFDVTVISDVYIAHDSIDNSESSSVGNVSVEIRYVEDVENERAAEAVNNWLETTFSNLNISPQELLHIFKDAGMKFSTAAVALDFKKKVKITVKRVREIVVKLYNDYPEIYASVLETPPKGRGIKTAQPTHHENVVDINNGKR